MAGRITKKTFQNIFAHTGSASNTTNDSTSEKISFHGSNENFIENGGMLLKERVSLFHGKTNPIRCLSVHDLNTTFQDWMRVDSFGYGNWYKCVWEERPVLVKLYDTYSVCDEYKHQILQRCFREIAIATQMGIHKNVHKLLACCLETEYPVLVYEFLANGFLRRRTKDDPLLEWTKKLRNMWEISHVLAYLHSAFLRPIVYRDLKPDNVLLDVDNAVKLSDFSFSVSIPEGKTYVEPHDHVGGVSGYLAPEYLISGKLVEKSDVYSFGMLFHKLLTRKFPHHCLSVEDDNVLCDDEMDEKYEDKRLRACLKDKLHISKIINNIFITDNRASMPKKDHIYQQLESAMELILRCIATDVDSRPTMEEAAIELKNIIIFNESYFPNTKTSTAK